MILATVTLYQCDECALIVAVKSDEDFDKFEQTWYAGLRSDFCPKCRYLIKTQARILRDEQTILGLAQNSEQQQQKYAN